MRVIESPINGDLVQAANDEELLRELKRHYEAEGTPLSDEEAQRLVSTSAYSATDS